MNNREGVTDMANNNLQSSKHAEAYKLTQFMSLLYPTS